MATKKEKFVTVGELRKWLHDESIPNNWVLKRTEYGFNADDPDSVCGVGFSLVPEDEEE